MSRILRLLVASALTLTFMGSRQPASAQKSPAFGAKFKIAEGADLRILDDNIWGLQPRYDSAEVEGNRGGPEGFPEGSAVRSSGEGLYA